MKSKLLEFFTRRGDKILKSWLRRCAIAEVVLCNGISRMTSRQPSLSASLNDRTRSSSMLLWDWFLGGLRHSRPTRASSFWRDDSFLWCARCYVSMRWYTNGNPYFFDIFLPKDKYFSFLLQIQVLQECPNILTFLLIQIHYLAIPCLCLSDWRSNWMHRVRSSSTLLCKLIFVFKRSSKAISFVV